MASNAITAVKEDSNTCVLTGIKGICVRAFWLDGIGGLPSIMQMDALSLFLSVPK
jgi:hypothetical protein